MIHLCLLLFFCHFLVYQLLANTIVFRVGLMLSRHIMPLPFCQQIAQSHLVTDYTLPTHYFECVKITNICLICEPTFPNLDV